jgi:hypothetical protein
VVQLNVETDWAIAGSTFHPKGWLASHFREAGASDRLTESAASIDCATVATHAESMEAARAQARDAVGLLRYYQRYLQPHMATQAARFGLTDEVFVNDNLAVCERDGKAYSYSVGIVGRYGSFEFGAGHIDYFKYVPGLTVLSESLATATPSDWQKRFRACLSFLGQAALIDEQQLRIVLLAARLEVLLADGSMARPPEGRPKGTMSDEVARRCAFLTCGTKGAPEDRPGHPQCEPDFCPPLTAGDANARSKAARRRNGQGRYVACEAFEAARQLFEDRNAVLHQGRNEFSRADVTGHTIVADRVVLSAARWVQAAGANRLKELVRAIPPIGATRRPNVAAGLVGSD